MVYFPYHRDKLLALATVDPYTAWYDFEYSRSLHDVANLVSYFNATFNFAIYVFSGSKFRAELRSLLCCKAEKDTSLLEILMPPASKLPTKTVIVNTI
ncbi:hypothetical protein DPMN_144209 [Dreissena polymorpha]|uniref:Uncharacterized protein n=1 Tax=Dreissena polymorpha TaxID=45954 RepID=A0A9D4GF63_DREPO|nr:hypothetical protein DPMN_144209 [Dreissena polymorpha]